VRAATGRCDDGGGGSLEGTEKGTEVIKPAAVAVVGGAKAGLTGAIRASKHALHAAWITNSLALATGCTVRRTRRISTKP
jgi:hypothetical protein